MENNEIIENDLKTEIVNIYDIYDENMIILYNGRNIKEIFEPLINISDMLTKGVDLQFTKFFKVKSPEGRFKTGNFGSIGVDFYFPEITEEFLDALVISNKRRFKNVSIEKTDFQINLVLDNVTRLQYIKASKIIHIYGDITIPTGIGVNLPNYIHSVVRSKSSNFDLGYTCEEGTIDEDYTYGMGVQMKLREKIVTLEPNQKFAQHILQISPKVNNMIELSNDEWNNNNDIIEKRKSRTGGFGHTGKK